MVTPPPSSATDYRLARQVREHFVSALDGLIVDLAPLIQTHLNTLAQGGWRGGNVAEMQRVMDAATRFEGQRQAWVADLADAGLFGRRGTPEFARSEDWRREADRILAHGPRNKDC